MATPELMPAPIVLAHRLVQRQAALRRSGSLQWLRPAGKSQVTFRYVDGHPVEIDAVVLSTQHSLEIGLEEVRSAVQVHIIDAIIPQDLRSKDFRTLINPTNHFVTGGPKGDE